MPSGRLYEGQIAIFSTFVKLVVDRYNLHPHLAYPFLRLQLQTLFALPCVCLTSRFHFAVVCSVIDTQMTSQCGKNKKVAHETKSSVVVLYVTVVLYTL